ncbi:MAG TPA: type IX secretion system sortase PorU [candidate division Zixibacteria bacterium]|nr:type IX secretion system sortase PorU [candidate division Zixibacteria bacterium]
MELYHIRAEDEHSSCLFTITFSCKLLFLFFITLSFSSRSFASAMAVTSLSSDQAAYSFSVSIDQSKLDWTLNSDSTITYYTSVQVGIPFGSRVSVSGVEGSNEQPFLKPLDSTYRVSTASLPLVDVSKPITVRGRQSVTVYVFPVNGSTLYGDVRATLRFAGAKSVGRPAAPDPIFDKIFQSDLANGAQATAWAKPSRASAKPSAQEGPFTKSVDWLRISVNQTGLYRVTGAQLAAAGLSIAGLQSSDIHLYNAGGLPLEVYNELPRPDFREVALNVVDGGDGILNSSDYFIFYGQSQDRWVYPDTGSPYYENNAYCDHNVYWLGISSSSPGVRMTAVDASSGTPDTTISTYTDRQHVEQDNLLRSDNEGKIYDYYTWYWTDSINLSFFVSTPQAVAGGLAFITLNGLTFDTTGASDELGYMDLSINNQPGLNKSCNIIGCSYQTTSLVNGLNRIDMRLWPSVGQAAYFDYFEIAYTSKVAPVSNKLDLPLGHLSGNVRVQVADGFSQSPLVMDISDPLRPVLLAGAQKSNGVMTYFLTPDPSKYTRIYHCPVQLALNPARIEMASPADLYAVGTQADLIVVTPKVLSGALEQYIAYRRSTGYTVEEVSVDDIMDNFGFGLYDPTAIRDFLKYAYQNYPSPAPSAVLFVGDANYDYRDHLKSGVPNYVPSYLSPYDNSASDDNYVYFGTYGYLDGDSSYSPTDRGFDMMSARWPVRTAQEIATITNKIIDYESSADLGLWRSNITLVADDEFGQFDNETIHTIQTEQLANEHVPNFLNIQKIYLWDYPFVNNRKPAVNDAIVKAINDGTLLINYVGHGNPDVWAHEYVFTRTDDLPRLTNIEHLPLVYAASCAIGFFDHPTRQGMAEDLLYMPNGGAVGVISATRLVYSSPNSEFNRAVFDLMLYNKDLSMCEAVYAAKLRRQYVINDVTHDTTRALQPNDRNYLYFGDPFVKLGVPSLNMEFTEKPDTLIALGTSQIAGRIVDGSGNPVSANGTVYMTTFDSERQRVHRLVNSSGVVTQTVPYKEAGPTIYRGSGSVTDGQFSLDFISPLDLGYGGDGARISLYALLDGVDGVGVDDSIHLSDSVAATSDSAGPQIEVVFADHSPFLSGDYVSRNDKMKVRISDPSGVNLAAGLGHGITLEIDNESSKAINLTSLFNYDKDNYTVGSLTYALSDLTPGSHHFKVKAWDNANNSSGYEFDARVLSSDAFAIKDLLNYPNPMRASTRFSFTLTQPADRVTLEVFTLSGRKIVSVDRYGLPSGYYDDIQWDGRDMDGDRVASEVYIYKATAYSSAGGREAESFGKVVLIN